MNITINIKDLKKIHNYLAPADAGYLAGAIITYVEEGWEFTMLNEKMQMIWDDIKPQLDKSVDAYNKWLKTKSHQINEEKEKQRIEKIIRIFEEQRNKNHNYVGNIKDFNNDNPSF